MKIISSEVCILIFSYILGYLRDSKSVSEFRLEKMVSFLREQKIFSVA